MSAAFETSATRGLAADAVLECGVCWWVYDPAVGDPVRDIAPGAPFSALPADWRCPKCDAPAAQFMVKGAVAAGPSEPGAETMEARVRALVAAYESAEKAIVGLPVHNDRLDVEAVGFRPMAEGYVGVIATPWCMNLTIVAASADAPPAGAIGAKRVHVFPSGSYTFVIGRMEGVGAVETCSLFSPMDEFDDPVVVRLSAHAAIEGLFETPPPAPPKKVSRRFVLTRNGAPA